MDIGVIKKINDTKAKFDVAADGPPSDATYGYSLVIKDKNQKVVHEDSYTGESFHSFNVSNLLPGEEYLFDIAIDAEWVTMETNDKGEPVPVYHSDFGSESFNFYTHPGIWYWIKTDGVTIGVKTDEFLADYLTVNNYNKFRIWVGQYNSWFEQISDYKNYSNLPDASTETFITAELYNNMLKASDVDNKYVNGGNEIVTREKKDNLITAAAFNLFTEKGFPMTKWGFEQEEIIK